MYNTLIRFLGSVLIAILEYEIVHDSARDFDRRTASENAHDAFLGHRNNQTLGQTNV